MARKKTTARKDTRKTGARKARPSEGMEPREQTEEPRRGARGRGAGKSEPSRAGRGRKARAGREEEMERGGGPRRTPRGNGRAAAGDGQRAMRGRRRDDARADGEEEIHEMFGFVPDFYHALPDATFEHAWGLERDFEFEETALDPKTKELIGLAVASHIKCRYCMYFHTKAALHHGATDEQLREAIAMGGLTVLFSNNLSGAMVDFEKFQRDVDRAIAHMSEHEEPRRGIEARA